MKCVSESVNSFELQELLLAIVIDMLNAQSAFPEGLEKATVKRNDEVKVSEQMGFTNLTGVLSNVGPSLTNTLARHRPQMVL